MPSRDDLPRIHMLGRFSVSYGDTRIDLTRQQTGFLLARLALKPGQEVSREELVAIIWPDVEREEARARLRQRLYALGQLFDQVGWKGGAVVGAGRETMWLDPTRVTTDLGDFKTMLADALGSNDRIDRIHRLETALDSYNGGLLPGFYQDVFLDQQGRVADLAEEGLRCLAEALEGNGELVRALGYARRMASADPLSEKCCLRVMRLLGAMGRRQEVLHQFETTERALAEHLGAEPSPEMREALQAAMRSEIQDPSDPASIRRPVLLEPVLYGGDGPETVLNVALGDRTASRQGPLVRRRSAAIGAMIGCGVLGVYGVSRLSASPGREEAPKSPSLTANARVSPALIDAAQLVVNSRQDYGRGYVGPNIHDGVIQLIDEHIGEAAAVWLKQPVQVHGFTTSFRFRVTNPPDNPGILADGFTFTVQNEGAESLGGSGGSLGYAGIVRSVCLAIYFHRARNDQPLTQPTWGISFGGHPPLETVALPLPIGNGHVYRTQIEFDGKDAISASMTDEENGQRATYRRNLSVANLLKSPNGLGWVGFTGGTGMGWAHVQISDWTFSSST